MRKKIFRETVLSQNLTAKKEKKFPSLMQPDFRININFVPKLHLFSLLLIVALKKEMSMEQ